MKAGRHFASGRDDRGDRPDARRATRNAADFADSGLELIFPWTP